MPSSTSLFCSEGRQSSVAKDPDILQDYCLHLLQGWRCQSFSGYPTFESVFLVIYGGHHHLSLEEMTKHREALDFLAICTHVADLT